MAGPEANDGKRSLVLDPAHFEDEASIVSFIDDLHAEGQHLKWPYARVWFYNINFYLGRQYVIPNDASKKFHDKARTDPKWRVRHVANKIAPFVTRKIAKLTRDAPVLEVSPATGDMGDIQKARLGNRVIEFLWTLLRMQDVLANEALLWLCTTGNVFLKPCWNPNAGPRLRISREAVDTDLFQELATASLGREATPEEIEQVQEIDQAIGEVDIHVVSPFSFFCHPNARRVEDSLWVLESNIKDLDSLREEWGPPAFGVKEESDADMQWGEYEERLLENVSSATSTQRTKRGAFPKVIEKQFWLRPCRQYPEGKLIVIAGGKVLHSGAFPYLPPNGHGELPYIHLKDKKVPGRFWAQSQIEDAIPPQKAYNSLLSKRQENINVHANVRWLNPKGSGVPRTAFNNEPGSIIDYVGPNKPEQVAPPPFPPAVMELAHQHLADLDDITGQQEASRGIAPGRVDSAQGIVALQEADDTMLGPLNKHLAEQYAKVGSQILSLVYQYYTEDRLLKIVGRRGIIEVRSFTGKDLAGEGFQGRFDVRVRVGSGLPLGRVARSEFIMNVLRSGLYDPNVPISPRHREAILRVLDIGGPMDDLFAEAESARAQAHIENADIAAGAMHVPNEWDDDAAHLDVHAEFERRPEYLKLVEMDPGLQQRMFEHKRLHMQAQALKQAWRQSIASAFQPQSVPMPAEASPQQMPENTNVEAAA